MAQLEHVGIAIEDATEVIDTFQDLLGIGPYKTETVDAQQVRTHFINGGGSKLELLEATDDDSPVHQFLDRDGEGLHHLAFEVSDAEAAMQTLRDAGFTLLSETLQPGADDKQIFFVHPKDTHGVLVEFCQSVASSWAPRQVPHRDGTLSVFERGNPDDPTLLFIHGAAGSTLNETAPLIRHLEPSFHTVGVDLSGHGASSFVPDGSLRMEAFVQDAIAALDAVDEPSAHVFGFSLGGAVAIRLAQVYPECVGRLALFQTNVRWPADLASRMERRLNLERKPQQPPERAHDVTDVHENPERLFRELRSFIETLPVASEPMWHTLSEVTAPTLVSSVDRDPLFDLDVPRTLHEKLPNAQLAILPGAAHSLTEAPLSILASLVRNFLRTAEPVASPPRTEAADNTPA